RKEFEAKRAKLYGAQTQTATAAPPATPPASEPPPLSEEDLEELERMTSGNKIPPTPPAPIIPIPPTKSATPTPQPAAGPTATELNVRPITPPELNRLSESEKIRIAKNADLIIPKPAESGRTTTPEPINIDFSRIAGKRIVDEGPITPPEQKPTPIPEPIKTIVEREQNANKNQISVIPKFIPADQPKRIEYKGPVTPPPTPVIPEPIRSFLQEEKEKKDNQVERKNTL
ncbi:MAG: hypothetical protein Q7R63_01510, partial [bacterium]|nr:hypothetical protein [bacterium]